MPVRVDLQKMYHFDTIPTMAAELEKLALLADQERQHAAARIIRANKTALRQSRLIPAKLNLNFNPGLTIISTTLCERGYIMGGLMVSGLQDALNLSRILTYEEHTKIMRKANP